MIGLKRGTVKLYVHQKEWETEAKNTILKLKDILGGVIKNIAHIGSTSIPGIMAKPIIDIALAVDDFNDILAFEAVLRNRGFYYRPNADIANQLLFACGNFYDGTGDMQTHFIHIVLTDSIEWKGYISFKNYLINNPQAAKEYENLKLSLAEKVPIDKARARYLAGKHDFIVSVLEKARDYYI